MKKAMAGTIVAGAMAATLALFGCGGQQASSSASSTSSAASSQSSSQQQSNSTSSSNSSSASSSNSSTSSTSSAAQTAAAQISAEEAKQIALKDAGLSEADVTELKAELDTDDAVVHYDVDFKANGMEYDYDIDASTGAILTRSSEVDD